MTAKYVTLVGTLGPLTLLGKPRARFVNKTGRWVIRFTLKSRDVTVFGRSPDPYEAWWKAYVSGCRITRRHHP
jgi:hypothetical protein